MVATASLFAIELFVTAVRTTSLLSPVVRDDSAGHDKGDDIDGFEGWIGIITSGGMSVGSAIMVIDRDETMFVVVIFASTLKICIWRTNVDAILPDGAGRAVRAEFRKGSTTTGADDRLVQINGG